MLYQRHIVLAFMTNLAETCLLFVYFCNAMRKRLKTIQSQFLALLQADAPSSVIVLKLQGNMLRGRRSERGSAAWKLPCSDSGTRNYPPLPGNRLKISRELIISTKYPNPHLCISWWRVNILHCVLLHPLITRGGAELNYYSWAGVTVPIPDRAEFQICHLPQVLILQRWGHRHVTFTNTAVDK